ncbi:MAG: peptide-methionine (S)-S-oxide reductase [Bacteroidales bacterium]|nr:peptide-methionine (S)-S-oxide reductase [Bacteroidales bacterium]
MKLYNGFYPAENYHQDYYKNNPSKGYCVAVINPKLVKIRNFYSKFLK